MSNISWTGQTWNPIAGCSKVSEGCRNCYAINQAYRNWAIAQSLPEDKRGRLKYYEGLTEKRGDLSGNGKVDRVEWTGRVTFVPEALEIPLARKKPETYFVNSMSDLFHESVSDDQLDQIFAVMALTPQHTYQILTKRTERMLEYFQRDPERNIFKQACAIADDLPLLKSIPHQWVLPNVWVGVSIENQKAVSDRARPLYQLRNAGWKTFYSVEPLLEEVELYLNHEPVDWVIVGGESGSNARPCDVEWIRSIVQQCQHTQIPVWVKQLGSNHQEWIDGAGDVRRVKLRDRKGADITEFPDDLRLRQFPGVAR